MLEPLLHKSDSLYIGSFSNQRPVDFISASSTTTVNGLGIPTALRLGDHDSEVIAAPGTGAGKVYGHTSRLTLEIGPYNLAYLVNREAKRTHILIRQLSCPTWIGR